MTRFYLLLFCAFSLCGFNAYSQCAAGELEVSIEVTTDPYGYELYWQLLPAANACGNGPIFIGGNTAVGCNGGGAQAQTPGGYANNTLVTEGPWCVVTGNSYKIAHIDDWGDGGTEFTVLIEGVPGSAFQGATTGEVFTFSATEPAARDASIEGIHVPLYAHPGAKEIEVEVRNTGSNAITSIEVAYDIDGGTPVTETFTGLNMASGDREHLMFTTPWNASAVGEYTIATTIMAVNGQGADEVAGNDALNVLVNITPPTPNIIPSYTDPGATYTIETVGNSTDQVDDPTDLDFHPNGNLWVTNFGTENSGGSTVTFTDPGEGSQSSLWLQDGNAWHFMSLPSALAFSDNGNFATSTAVFDANHDGGTPFTGPALWSSSMQIYAQPSGGNGSHLDMLHESPNCMGIASDHENVFWLMDAYNNDVVMYDFGEDHGPGNDDHSDGRILRYKGMSVDWINQNIPSHLVLQKASNWLYIVDGGNKRVLRMDITSGTVGGTPTFGPHETIAQYENVTGATWEEVITTGLDQPCGIDIIDNQLIVSDYGTGDIIFYNLSTMPATEEGRISTAPGITGVKIGPEGRIWFTNKTESTVNKIEPGAIISGIDAAVKADYRVQLQPNPAAGRTTVIHAGFDRKTATVSVYDAMGRTIQLDRLMDGPHAVDVSQLAPGIYTVVVADASNRATERLVVR